jgi:hypothetical protein
MKAFRIAAGISCCLILAGGCGMCQHPYYDCGPVWSQGECQNCNPDYRAGSILNRQASGVMTADGVVRTARPAGRAGEYAYTAVSAAPRAAQTAQVAPHRSEGSESRLRATAVAQRRRPAAHAPAEEQSPQEAPAKTVMPEAPLPGNLPPNTVAAPPGTKEGATRILSVTDRRLDELQKNPKPVAIQNNAPQRMAEKSSGDFDGWRPVATQQNPAETATQLREIER